MLKKVTLIALPLALASSMAVAGNSNDHHDLTVIANVADGGQAELTYDWFPTKRTTFAGTPKDKAFNNAEWHIEERNRHQTGGLTSYTCLGKPHKYCAVLDFKDATHKDHAYNCSILATADSEHGNWTITYQHNHCGTNTPRTVEYGGLLALNLTK